MVAALGQAGFVVDCTIEGLMHAPETPAILKAGARILVISNEHPEALERMAPDGALEKSVRAAAKMLRGAKRMTVTSAAGTELDIDMAGASTVGVWGWTDKPGTLAHWPGGIVVSFCKSGSVNGTLVLDRGDINLTFKRYLEAPVRLDAGGRLRDAHRGRGRGRGDDAQLSRRLGRPRGLRRFSHVGFGLNRKARYEALAMYDRADTNGTELRAVAGNFLFSTGRQRVRRPLHRRPFRHSRSCAPLSPSMAPRSCARACCRILLAEQPAQDRPARDHLGSWLK